MLACTDVHYRATGARGACVLFRAWTDAAPAAEHTVTVPTPGEYHPGRFFERELPVLLELLRGLPDPLNAILIDGYVWLGSRGEPGLGAHLFDALGERVPVIGVAKTAYRGSGFAVPVLRGQGHRPLYVTAAGTDPQQAAEHVRGMHGEHRIPTLLARVDRLSRGA